VHSLKLANTLPAVLHLKPDEVDTPEKRSVYTVTVVGCGQKGIFYALAFAEAGFKVTCTDADQSVVKRLSKGNIKLDDDAAETKLKSFMRKDQLNATIDIKAAVSASNVIIITVSPKIDAKKCSDASEVENVCKLIGATLPKESLVVYCGFAALGSVEGMIKETVQNTSGLKAGEDFGLAYNPLQNSAGRNRNQIGEEELTIAANDKYSLNCAGLVFETIAKKGVKRISEVTIAELSALFAAVKRDANQALTNELAMFCENVGVDYAETIKNNCEISIAPTLSEEANRDEAYLLIESAENLNVKLRLPTLARQVNEDMIRHAVNLTQEALRSGGKTLRRARIAVIGATDAGTSTAAFIELLESKGAKISSYDPCCSGSEQLETESSVKKTLNEAVEGTDCLVILSAQEQLKRLNLKKLRAIMKSPAAFVDFVGTIEPTKVEKEGFTYRGLGKGAWKK
jgi:nucleotide sugar dehydrogenase